MFNGEVGPRANRSRFKQVSGLHSDGVGQRFEVGATFAQTPEGAQPHYAYEDAKDPNAPQQDERETDDGEEHGDDVLPEQAAELVGRLILLPCAFSASMNSSFFSSV